LPATSERVDRSKRTTGTVQLEGPRGPVRSAALRKRASFVLILDDVAVWIDLTLHSTAIAAHELTRVTSCIDNALNDCSVMAERCLVTKRVRHQGRSFRVVELSISDSRIDPTVNAPSPWIRPVPFEVRGAPSAIDCARHEVTVVLVAPRLTERVRRRAQVATRVIRKLDQHDALACPLRICTLNCDQAIGPIVREIEIAIAAARDPHQARSMIVAEPKLATRERAKRAQNGGRLRAMRNEAQLRAAQITKHEAIRVARQPKLLIRIETFSSFSRSCEAPHAPVSEPNRNRVFSTCECDVVRVMPAMPERPRVSRGAEPNAIEHERGVSAESKVAVRDDHFARRNVDEAPRKRAFAM
jgi:hypothetical protein